LDIFEKLRAKTKNKKITIKNKKTCTELSEPWVTQEMLRILGYKQGSKRFSHADNMYLRDDFP
jgi:hypothetical protein